MEEFKNEKVGKIGEELKDFMTLSTTAYHTVDTVSKELVKNGFSQLDEQKSWEKTLQKSGKYFITRNNSSMVAFTVGSKFKSGNGVKIIGAHTDSPHLRLKLIGKDTKEGCKTVQVTTYGGGIWRTWFDREFGLAGKVLIEKDGELITKLVNIYRPLFIIPSLAIHLDTHRDSFKFSKESHLVPVLTTIIKDQIKGKPKPKEKTVPKLKKVYKQHPELMKLIAKRVGEPRKSIVGFELNLINATKPKIGGINKDMIFSHGIDNKFACFCAMKGLINSSNTLEEDAMINMMVLYDHEEIGSLSRSGAKSMIVNNLIRRVNKLFKTKETPKDYYNMCIAKSFLVSCDGAHAVHPSYSHCHHSNFKPKINKGPVIKININQRYTTNSESLGLMKKLMDKCSVPFQLFQVKNDSRCGTTIGPIASSLTEIRAIDMGQPQWSMHSIRETAGVFDCFMMTKLFTKYYETFENFLFAKKKV